jgi:hypothetical protein
MRSIALPGLVASRSFGSVNGASKPNKLKWLRKKAFVLLSRAMRGIPPSFIFL